MNKIECLFCKIVSGEIESNEVYEDENFIGILDTQPRAKGHTLIISKQHFRNILDMPSTLGNELIEASKKISLKMIEENDAEGTNILINNESVAGQIIFHAHIHIIPRIKGDGLKI